MTSGRSRTAAFVRSISAARFKSEQWTSRGRALPIPRREVHATERIATLKSRCIIEPASGNATSSSLPPSHAVIAHSRKSIAMLRGKCPRKAGEKLVNRRSPETIWLSRRQLPKHIPLARSNIDSPAMKERRAVLLARLAKEREREREEEGEWKAIQSERLLSGAGHAPAISFNWPRCAI